MRGYWCEVILDEIVGWSERNFHFDFAVAVAVLRGTRESGKPERVTKFLRRDHNTLFRFRRVGGGVAYPEVGAEFINCEEEFTRVDVERFERFGRGIKECVGENRAMC